MAGGKTRVADSGGVFTTGSTMRHVVVMASTGAVGLIAIFLVDLANLFYISLLGQQVLAAAVGYASTIMFFAISVSIGFTIAATALTARAIGQGDMPKARSAAGASLIYVFVSMCVLTAILYPLIGEVLSLIGATGEPRAIAIHFMQIAVPSLPLLGLGMCASGLLRAVGDARRAMYVTLSSGLSAAVIDPILIFYFDLGITGAAISVVLVRVLFVLVGFHGTMVVHRMVAMPDLAALKDFLRPFMIIGSPAILTQLATPFGNAYVTGAFASYGDDAVAGWAIVGRIIPLAVAGIFSLSGAVGPILSQNYGAGRLDRVQRAMRDSLLFTPGYVFAMWALLAAANGFIADAFNASGDARDMVRIFCLAVAGMQVFLGFLFVANAAFNNLGHAFLSTVFNWGRATLGVIPFVWVGANWGPTGMILGWGMGGILFGITAVITCFAVIRKLPIQAERDGIAVQVPPVGYSPFSSGRGAGIS